MALELPQQFDLAVTTVEAGAPKGLQNRQPIVVANQLHLGPESEPAEMADHRPRCRHAGAGGSLPVREALRTGRADSSSVASAHASTALSVVCTGSNRSFRGRSLLMRLRISSFAFKTCQLSRSGCRRRSEGPAAPAGNRRRGWPGRAAPPQAATNPPFQLPPRAISATFRRFLPVNGRSAKNLEAAALQQVGEPPRRDRFPRCAAGSGTPRARGLPAASLIRSANQGLVTESRISMSTGGRHPSAARTESSPSSVTGCGQEISAGPARSSSAWAKS